MPAGKLATTTKKGRCAACPISKLSDTIHFEERTASLPYKKAYPCDTISLPCWLPQSLNSHIGETTLQLRAICCIDLCFLNIDIFYDFVIDFLADLFCFLQYLGLTPTFFPQRRGFGLVLTVYRVRLIDLVLDIGCRDFFCIGVDFASAVAHCYPPWRQHSICTITPNVDLVNPTNTRCGMRVKKEHHPFGWCSGGLKWCFCFISTLCEVT